MKAIPSMNNAAGQIAAYQIKARNGRARLICIHGPGAWSPVELENWLIENLEPNRAIRLVGLFEQVDFAANREHARLLALNGPRKPKREQGLAATPTALTHIEALVDRVLSRWRKAPTSARKTTSGKMTGKMKRNKRARPDGPVPS